MKALKIFEELDFQRGLDPKEAMDIGLQSKYGKMYNLFIVCHNLSVKSDSFAWVSDIAIDEDGDPYFNIESLFYYTDEKNIAKIPEEFIVSLCQDYLFVENKTLKDEYNVKSVRRFIELTKGYDEETAEEVLNIDENLNFERGQDPHKAMRIGKWAKDIREIISADIEIMPEPGNQDTYYDESIDSIEIKEVLNNWEFFISKDNYAFWLIDENPDSPNNDPEYTLWKDLEGTTVKFGNDYYEIPKTKYKFHG